MRERNYSSASRINFPWADAPKICYGPIKEAPNLKSFSTNEAKQNRVDHPLALGASRCGGLSFLHTSHYRKSSQHVNGHAWRQEISPSRDCS